MDILNYYRKFIEKSRSFCTRLAANIRDGFCICITKLRSFCAELAANIRNDCRTFTTKLKSFCAAYLNVKRTDIFLIVAVVAVLAYIIVNHAVKAVNGPARINISISSQCADLFGREAVDALIQEFEKQHPNLRIQEAVDGADIVFFDDSEYRNLVNDSALSLVSFMDLFIYNIDILQAANLDRPPKTRAEFLNAARVVAENDTVSAFALSLSPTNPLALRRDIYPWLWASGVDIHAIDLAGDNPALPRTVADTIAFFGQLHRDKLLAPGTFETTGMQRLQEFAEGKIAMMSISARDLAFLQNNAHGITFGITALPTPAQGKNRVGLSSIYAGINGNSAISDEARILLSFLAKKSNALAEAIGAVPGSYPGVFAGEHIAKNPLYTKAWEIFEAADIVEYKPGRPSEEAFNQLLWEKLVETFDIQAVESN